MNLDEIDVDKIHDYVADEDSEAVYLDAGLVEKPETGDFTINLGFADGDRVKVQVSEFRNPANAAAALFRIGQPEALDEIFAGYVAAGE